jgi:hypothetical protein
MKNLKTKFALLSCGVAIVNGVLSGCDPVYEMVKCPSYVVYYTDLSAIYVESISTSSQCVVLNAVMNTSKSYGLHSVGEAKERYNQLCIKHHDLSYNKYRKIGKGSDVESVTYGASDFSNITVIADKDFDNMHPAGTNLSDIVRFMSWSPYKYILSGYSKYYHYDKSDVSEAFDTLMRIYIDKKFFDNATEATCYPIDKSINDLTTEDLILIGYDTPLFLGLLYFEKTPDTKDDYDITVTIKTDENKVLSDTVKLTF